MNRRDVAAVILCAALFGGLRFFPYVLAQSATPAGWQFTGNWRETNPDFMQYRVWFRQTLEDGPIVRNVFTSEPNEPHLLLLFQFAIGRIAHATGAAPEVVFEYAGGVLTALFVVVLYVTTRRFFPSPYQRWWVFGALLVGGGAGAHLKLLLRFEAVKQHPIVDMILWTPLNEWMVFEDYRGHYVFTTFFDPHFLVNWILATVCVLGLVAYLERPRAGRLALVGLLFAAMTVMHLYEGVTLVAIAAGIAVICGAKRVAVRPALTALALTTAIVLVCIAWQQSLVRHSGLPTPDWRANVILPTILFLAYPLAWVLAASGLPRLWRDADLNVVVLIGWLLGCTLLTLSGPFYPYPDRGTVTLQIPLTILAGLAYFRWKDRVSMRAAVVAAVLLLATPAWMLARMATNVGFDADAPTVYQDASHRAVVEALRARAGREDILLADSQSVLWLAPEYPGRHYCAHFFLTANFARKSAEVDAFFRGAMADPAAFIHDKGIRFVFVRADQHPERLRGLPGLSVALENAVGTLFAVAEAPRS